MNMSGKSNCYYCVCVCYCLIVNVHTVMAKIQFWLHLLDCTHHPKPCARILSQDEARCHPITDATLLLCCTFTIFATCTMHNAPPSSSSSSFFSHYLILSIELIAFQCIYRICSAYCLSSDVPQQKEELRTHLLLFYSGVLHVQ